MGSGHLRNTTQRNRYRARLIKLGLPCAICGRPIDYTLPGLDPMSFHADHKIPLARGGADTFDNLQPTHRLCNARKGTRQYAPIIRRSGALD